MVVAEYEGLEDIWREIKRGATLLWRVGSKLAFGRLVGLTEKDLQRLALPIAAREYERIYGRRKRPIQTPQVLQPPEVTIPPETAPPPPPPQQGMDISQLLLFGVPIVISLVFLLRRR